MLHINKEKVVIIISLIIIMLNLITLPKKKYSYDSYGNSQIAKGIITLEQDEIIEKMVDETLFPLEYNFTVNNFDDKDNINEVDFDYKIRIESSVQNFPVKYKLIDVDNGKEMHLNNDETPILTLEKMKKESRHFKLYVQWNDVDLELADELEIKLKIDAVQSKEENVNEEEN